MGALRDILEPGRLQREKYPLQDIGWPARKPQLAQDEAACLGGWGDALKRAVMENGGKICFPKVLLGPRGARERQV